jgi:hypothetical protein
LMPDLSAAVDVDVGGEHHAAHSAGSAGGGSP